MANLIAVVRLYSFNKIMKKNLIITIIVLIVMVTIVCFIPATVRGIKINKYQNEIKQAQYERSRCEMIMSWSHQKAEELRNKLSDELGLTTESQSPQRTWTEAPELTWSIIE